MNRKVKRYSDDFKQKVVKEYQTTSVSYKELREKYDIFGVNTIRMWVYKFNVYDPMVVKLKYLNRCKKSQIIIVKRLSVS